MINKFKEFHTHTKKGGVGLSAFNLLEGPGITFDNERMKISPHL